MYTIASQPTYLLKLQRRLKLAERTMAFAFEKPDSFFFNAGQSIDMTLMNASETDAKGNRRAFSIACAPHEDGLLVATRIRDTAFKRVLATMPIGAQVEVTGPFGDFILHNDAARPAVFLAGGIGITPFRSILLQATRERLQHSMLCFYANRRPESAPFLEALQAMQTPHSIKTVPTMTGISPLDLSWEGERGHIDHWMLARHVKSAASPVFCLAGLRQW
jgi:ferredoxin-NADP reductase